MMKASSPRAAALRDLIIGSGAWDVATPEQITNVAETYGIERQDLESLYFDALPYFQCPANSQFI